MEIAKWIETIKISWSNVLTYRLNLLLQILGPAIIFFFVKYNLWVSIFETSDLQVIQGYNVKTMITYHIWVLIIALLGQSSNSIKISEDIRLGRISSYLIYPFEFWKFHTAGYLAHTGLQVIISIFTLIILWTFGFLALDHPIALVKGFTLTIILGFLWFTIQYIFGLMAFWFEETWVFRVIFLTTSAFLSGSIIPLEIYPEWLTQFLMWTPFPYLTFVPAKIFMNSFDGSFLWSIGSLLFWIMVCRFVAGRVWAQGMKHYTAAGM